jgi:hypothetical protein
MISRRNFIKFGALSTIGGFALGIPGKLFGKTPGAGGLNLLSNSASIYTSKSFAPFVNTNFQIRHEDIEGYKNLRLLEVKDLNNQANNLKGFTGESFSLLFKSTNTGQIEGKVYAVSHDSLGEFSLFIAPVTIEPDHYEAVIFRLNA